MSFSGYSAGYSCPQCGGARTDVKDSRPRGEAGGIRRRRLCPSCGHRFTTWEVQAGDVDALMIGVQNAEPIVFKQVQALAVEFAQLGRDDRLVLLSLARRLNGGSVSTRVYEIVGEAA